MKMSGKQKIRRPVFFTRLGGAATPHGVSR
jgi:hypothetical protein